MFRYLEHMIQRGVDVLNADMVEWRFNRFSDGHTPAVRGWGVIVRGSNH